MNHYLEINEIPAVGCKKYDLWLQTGLGPSFMMDSHSLKRLERVADEMASILATNGIDKLKVQNNPKLAAMVPLVESYAHMRNES